MRDWTKDKHTLAYVLRRHWKGVALAVFVLLLFLTVQSRAYVISQRNGYDAVWDAPTVEMNIQLQSCPDVFEYTFYGPCRPGSTRHAMQDWNEVGSNFRFVELEGVTSDVCNHDDGINTIGWSRNFCGEQLSGTRAARTITTYRYESGVPVVAERDIILDLNYPWTKQAFQITILHELGHVIGLDHPNDHGQNVRAIMNNPIYDLAIQQDDIDGVIAIYGEEGEIEDEIGDEDKRGVRGSLENPSENGVVSGIGVISGWLCDADSVEMTLFYPDGSQIPAGRVTLPYKSERLDTQHICGDADNGFGLTVNWQILSPGDYTLEVFADGVRFATARFTVGGLGEEFFRGRDGQRYTVPDFPRQGQNTIIMWQESQQNFVVVETTPPN